MRKVNLVFIVSFIVLISSSLLFYILYFNNKDNKFFLSRMEKVKTKAPTYKNLFNDIDNDPHGYNNFEISREQCLACHELGMKIDRKNQKIETGNLVYTSGSDGIFFPGIPIGKVKIIDQKFYVEFFSDLSQLYFINVITSNPTGGGR